MIVLRDAIEIGASPELIFEWLGDLAKSYRALHHDHVCWEFQDGFREGSTCRCSPADDHAVSRDSVRRVARPQQEGGLGAGLSDNVPRSEYNSSAILTASSLSLTGCISTRP